MPLAPRRRAVLMLSTVSRRRQPVGADARPDRLRAGHLPHRRDLRRERRGVRRIGHRADDVEPAVLDPHRPVLEPVRRGLERLGIHGRAEQRLRTLRLHDRADAQQQRVEPRAAEPRPSFGVRVGCRQQCRHARRIESQALGRRHRRIEILPEGQQRRATVVEERSGIADVIQVDAIHRVAAHQIVHHAPPRDRRRRDESATGTALRHRRPRASSARDVRRTPGCADRSSPARRRAGAAPSASPDGGRSSASGTRAAPSPTQSGRRWSTRGREGPARAPVRSRPRAGRSRRADL